jgi:hypothetical protein
LYALHRRQERVGLRLDRLRQQSPGAVPQDRRQWIVGFTIGLTQGNNGAIARHGVSLVWGDFRQVRFRVVVLFMVAPPIALEPS